MSRPLRIEYLHREKRPDWLYTDFVLSLFSGQQNAARKQYRLFVESMLGREYESPLKGVVASSILGGAYFINEIRK